MTHTVEATAWTLIHFCWQAAAIAAYGPNEQQCMSVAELAEVTNFAPPGSLPAMSPWMLALLGVALAGAATVLLGRQS